MPNSQLENLLLERIKMLVNENGFSWESLKNFSFTDGNKKVFLESFRWHTPNGEIPTETQWINLVDRLEQKAQEVVPITLATPMLNDSRISSNPQSNWQMYKKRLEKKGWTNQAVSEIEASSSAVLKHLSLDTSNHGTPVKGLVVGNVQSGKTANMAGVMAMAADYGFNFFIVLTGTIENLRHQTEERLVSDMKETVEGMSSNHNWQVISKPSLKSRTFDQDISNLNLSEGSKDRFISVNLKNKSRLENLLKWLYSDANKCEQLKVLVIDDEADQASINTKDVISNYEIDEEPEKTAINNAIFQLVHGFNGRRLKGMNYISYTATPYANLLNQNDENSLYPSNFVIYLNSSPDYIGAREIFGLEEPEEKAKLEIVRHISEEDVQQINEVHKGESVEVPHSLKIAIQWYFLTLAAARELDYRKPITMLIHTSFKVVEHSAIEQVVSQYIISMRFNKENTTRELEKLYRQEKLYFTRNHFLAGMSAYSEPEKVPDYPSWDKVREQVEYIFSLEREDYLSHIKLDSDEQPVFHDGIHLAVDNSSSRSQDEHIRLVYPKVKQPLATGVIVIGGNTLSRGLTLEGLTTSYFLRTTKQADTLMQMGRWFGYRKGYEVLPRIWLEEDARRRFEFMSQLNEELKDEINEYAISGKAPLDYAPRIKNYPNSAFLRITSGNKMQQAEQIDFDFSGYNKQTIIFENDEEKLDSNLNATEVFLNKIQTSPSIRSNSLVWNGVSYDLVKEFIKNYQASEADVSFSKMPEFLEWFDKEDAKGTLDSWSVILGSKGEIKPYEGEPGQWNIHGWSPNNITRSRKGAIRSDGKTVTIGTLRSPSDLYLDIEEEMTSAERSKAKVKDLKSIRRKYGVENTPQLLIYRVDKGASEQNNEPENDLDMREMSQPLNFVQDVIGINIMIPAITRGGDQGAYLQQKIEIRDDEV